MASVGHALRRVKEDPFSILDRACVEKACHRAGHQWRDSALGPVGTVGLFVQQVAGGNLSIDELLRKTRTEVTASAYCQARQRLPLEVLTELTQMTHRAIDARTRAHRWKGHGCFFVDGSSVSMPDSDALRAYFGQPKGQREGCGFPVAHLLAMFDAQTGLLSEPVLSPLHTGDPAHLPLMHAQMAANDVLCGDTSFAGWGHFALLLRNELHGVMPNHHARIVDFTPRRRFVRPRDAESGKGLARSRWIASLGEKDQLVEWFKPQTRPNWIDTQDYDALPDSIIVREVQRTIHRPGFRPFTVTLVTTLLNPEQYPPDDLVALRMRRWDAETNLRHLKTTMGMDVLRCKTVAGVQKEVAVFTLVYNLVCSVMLAAAYRQRVPVHRISFAAALHWLRYARPGDPAPLLRTVPHRPGRVEPRALKRRIKEYDLLRQPRHKLREQLRNDPENQAQTGLA